MGDSSEDDKPLGMRAPPAALNAADSDSSDDVPLASRGKAAAGPQTSASSSEDSEDVPLSERRKVLAAKKAPVKKLGAVKRKLENGSDKKKPAADANKRQRTASRPRATKAGSSTRPRSGGAAANGKSGDERKWSTLVHSGVLFPPEYEPHGVQMLYNGKPVTLTPQQEEVATMFAVMKETDYMSKPVFLRNFWEGFKEVLGKGHVIQSLDKCDFTPIFEWHIVQRDKKKELTREEKVRMKEEKDAKEAKYKFALVDGRQEQVGNFRVEPPGLFRGRGEHPKMGKIKQRVFPRDITINIGPGAPVPEHPYPGQSWKEVRHDNTVTWLAYWRDTVNPKEYKYVWLGANSTFKADSDLAKYEKARKLKDYIVDIRRNYTADWGHKSVVRRQMAVALYFLDKLALRAGHEKDDDEADTVGCCTLKVENVELIAPSSLKFDFLGKDSIRYENTVDVEPTVYRNVQSFLLVDQHGKKKGPRDMLFDAFDATDLNKELKNLMDGLSVKVFRTYNASIVLDRLLHEIAEATAASGKVQSVDEKKADYDRANKEVAILCNHQRSVPKTHEQQMDKMVTKMKDLNAELAALEAELKDARKGNGNKNVDALAAKVGKKRQQIQKAELAARVKEDLKTVALGTSKINYMDPRITIAWCKRNEVPIEKIFNKSLISKFHWAMDVDWNFRF